MRRIGNADMALLEAARAAAGHAYCPYSGFPVGAAAECETGVHAGCNVENASYSLGICAERVALQSAKAAGARCITRLAVCCVNAVASDAEGKMPCGACRQVIAEFMAPDADVIIDGVGVWRVDELLPQAFRLT